MKKTSKDLIMFWNRLEISAYWTMVKNYKHNEIISLAIDLGLLHSCEGALVDRTKDNFCKFCGKDITIN